MKAHPYLPTANKKCRHCGGKREEHTREFIIGEDGKGSYVAIQVEAK